MRFVGIGAPAAIFLLDCCGEEGSEPEGDLPVCALTLTCGHELFKILNPEAKYTPVYSPVALWFPCAERMHALIE